MTDATGTIFLRQVFREVYRWVRKAKRTGEHRVCPLNQRDYNILPHVFFSWPFLGCVCKPCQKNRGSHLKF